MTINKKSRDKDSTIIASMKEYYQSSRFHWSMVSHHWVTEVETSTINANVKGLFGVLSDWKHQRDAETK